MGERLTGSSRRREKPVRLPSPKWLTEEVKERLPEGLTERQTELHTLLTTGVATYADAARAMRTSPSAVCEIKSNSIVRFPELEPEFFRMPKRKSEKYVRGIGKNVTPRQAEMHEYIVMGVPSVTDIAGAEGCSIENVSQNFRRSQVENPNLVLQFYNGDRERRMERVISLYRQNKSWKQIAEETGFTSVGAVSNAVYKYLGGNFGNVWDEKYDTP